MSDSDGNVVTAGVSGGCGAGVRPVQSSDVQHPALLWWDHAAAAGEPRGEEEEDEVLVISVSLVLLVLFIPLFSSSLKFFYLAPFCL